MGNVWKQFEDLLPKRKQFIGQVMSVNSTNKTCVVNLLGGETMTVKGAEITISNWYLIEEGEIKREVPALSYSSITIY